MNRRRAYLVDMDQRSVGLLIIGFGVVALVTGGLVYLGAFGWFGRLPGDVRIEGENTKVFVPITSMIVISVVLTLLANIFRRLL